ncbi:MAG: flavodoxin family protein [Candidatus Heimdallarchaeota archaeon]
MKKVVAVNSSKRKYNTYRALESMKPIFESEGIEYEIINLHDYKINYCNGCETCIKKDYCPIDDDVKKINEKLVQANGIILSTPVYMENISGALKTFIDRNCKWFHRSDLLRKPCLCLATTNGSGLKNVLNYLDLVATRWGMTPCGKIGRKINGHKTPVNRKEMGKFIEFIHNPEKIKQWISPSKFINYNVQKAVSLNLFEIDRKFWIEKEIDKGYYYPYITDPLSLLMGKFLFRLLSRTFEKNQLSRNQNY